MSASAEKSIVKYINKNTIKTIDKVRQQVPGPRYRVPPAEGCDEPLTVMERRAVISRSL